MSGLVGIFAPAFAGDAADPIDRLMTVTCGEVLRLPTGGERGGEYDPLLLVSTRVRRRLAGARLVSSDAGMWADELLAVAAARCPLLETMNPDEFVSWYVAECIAGLDRRADVRSGARWEDQCEPEPDADVVHRADFGVDAGVPLELVAGAPGWFTAWVLRTVHEPKVDVLMGLAQWAWSGGPAPVLPDAGWVAGLVSKFERRSGLEVPK